MDRKQRLEYLEKVVTSITAGDIESANTAFHAYATGAFRRVVEGDDPKSKPGDKVVRDTMKKTGDEEIAKNGEAYDDPKKAQGDKAVRDTIKKTGDKEIAKNGEAYDDPKKAPGDKAVRDTLKAVGDKEIKS